MEAQAAPDANDSLDVQDPQKQLPAPHGAVAYLHCSVTQGAQLAGMPNANWVSRVGTEDKTDNSDKSAQNHSHYLQAPYTQHKMCYCNVSCGRILL